MLRWLRQAVRWAYLVPVLLALALVSIVLALVDPRRYGR